MEDNMADKLNPKYNVLWKAKKAFAISRNRTGKGNLTFDQLRVLFKKVGVTYQSEDIAHKHGVSRQRISQIYHEFFRIAFRDLSIEELIRRNKARKIKARLHRKPPKGPAYTALLAIAKRAQDFGCAVEYVTHGEKVYAHRILINTHLCSVQAPNRRTRTPDGNTYIAVTITRSTVEAVQYSVFVIEINGCRHYFPIPSRDLYTEYFEKSPSLKQDRMYINVDPAAKILHPRIHTWKYQDAWPEAR